jgi:hypothetical protein
MNKRATAVRLTVEAVGVMLLAVLLVAKYESTITAINWRLVSLVCVGAACAFALYRWQSREDNAYDLLDLVMRNGKADLYAHIQIAAFGLAAWVIIQQALVKQPVTELVLGVLGIFVAGRAAGNVADAIGKRPAAVDNSQQQVNINPAPEPVVEPAPAPVVPRPRPVRKR